MKTIAAAALLAACSTLAACAYQWQPADPDIAANTFAPAQDTCTAQAHNNVTDVLAFGIVGAAIASQPAYDDCMRQHGWIYAKKAGAIP